MRGANAVVTIMRPQRNAPPLTVAQNINVTIQPNSFDLGSVDPAGAEIVAKMITPFNVALQDGDTLVWRNKTYMARSVRFADGNHGNHGRSLLVAVKQ